MTSCQFNATIPGIGAFVVGSATTTGVIPELMNIVDGKTYKYMARSYDSLGNATAWEAGSGIYTISSHSLSRVTITANSDDTTVPVNFPLQPIVDVFPNPSMTLEPALGCISAWCNWNGATGVINDSFNTASLVRSSAGVYIITFTKPFINALYSATFGSAGGLWFGSMTPASRTNSSFGITFVSTSFVAADPGFGFVQVFGRQ